MDMGLKTDLLHYGRLCVGALLGVMFARVAIWMECIKK